MNILFLRGFNNYFNRTIKKYSTLTDYQTNSTSYLNISNINFNPNDGVITELIIGNQTQLENNKPLQWDDLGTPDYAICYEMEGTPAVPNIKFRWFILESERTRNGQYRIALKRDVIADNFNEIRNAPCFIEKGILNDVNDPLLYNKESMTFNQIKTNEILLKDETQSAWIVGYLNNKVDADNTIERDVALDSNGQASGTYYHATGETISAITEAYVTAGQDLARHPEYVVASINSSGNITYSITWSAMYSTTVHLVIGYQRTTDIEIDANEDVYYASAIPASNLPWDFDPTGSEIRHVEYISPSAGYVFHNTSSNQWQHYYCNPKLYYNGTLEVFKPRNRDDVEAPWSVPATSIDISSNYYFTYNYFTNSISTYDYKDALNNGLKVSKTIATQIFALDNSARYSMSTENLVNYNNRIVSANNKYYRLRITNTGSGNNIVRIYQNTSLRTSWDQVMYTLFPYIQAELISSYRENLVFTGATNSEYETIDIYYTGYTIIAEELNSARIKLQLPASGARTHLTDGVYDMFCIPYNSVKFYNGTLTSNPSYSIAMALALSKYLGTQLYDLQLLPYFPARSLISDTNTVNERIGTENKDYSYITNSVSGDKLSFIIFCNSSSGTFDLNYSLSIPQVDANSTINRKISNECDLYRLVSPNYSGQFEFNLARNGGNVTSFNIDYTYRPYNPYIHVNPDFKGLYGSDWNDARGLICSGDFSLPIINDAWTEYQLQNKNYQNIFDRQIQNMDVGNEIALEQLQFQRITGALTGGITGAVGGAVAGAKIGGGYGAIGGAAVGLTAGTALSIIGGEKDEDWLRRQQQEARSYTKDMYSYNLGNIKAMPYSLTKSGTLTNNNKLFPIVEYYTCTQDEKEILKNIIEYDGMTIMAIDIINNFIPSDLGVKYILKGRLIRLEDLNDDFHIADAIYQELFKGVYLTSSLGGENVSTVTNE